MPGRKPSKFEFILLKIWHAWLAGSFLVAYVTADEDTYAMHLFAGYAVLAAILVRLLAGVAAPVGSPLRLPRPSMKTVIDWFAVHKGRNPLFAWLAGALLVVIGAAAVTGALADGFTWLEDLHEAASELALWVIFAHIAFVGYMHGGKRFLAWIGNRAFGVHPSMTARKMTR